MTVYHKRGGQLGYSGHVLNLPQNIQQFINELLVKVNDLPVDHATLCNNDNFCRSSWYSPMALLM